MARKFLNDLTSTAIAVIQPVLSGSAAKALSVTPGAHLLLPASTEAIDVDFANNRTVQWANGALGVQRSIVVRAPTLAFVSGSNTVTTAASMSLEGPPVAGGFGDITNPYTLWIESGLLALGSQSGSKVGKMVFNNGTNTNAITIQSGATSASYSLTLPTAQGAASTFLRNDGSGNLSWVTNGNIGGSIASTQVAYGSGTDTIAGSALLTFAVGTGTLTTNYLQLNTAAAIPSQVEGLLFYDLAAHALSYYNDVTGTSMQIGFENWMRAVNNTGATLLDGKVVYVSGVQGNRPTATLAVASSNLVYHVVGVVTADIIDNAEGHVTTFGVVNGVSTSAFTAGDELFVDPTTPGNLTNVRPVAPLHAVRVGYALNSTVNGSILVSVDTGNNLSELHDVLITSAAAGDFLRHNGTTWVDSTIQASDVPLTSTHLAFGSATNALTSSAGVTWTDATKTLKLGVASTSTGILSLACSGSANLVNLTTAATSAAYTLTLPAAQAVTGTRGQVMAAIGSGQMVWQDNQFNQGFDIESGNRNAASTLSFVPATGVFSLTQVGGGTPIRIWKNGICYDIGTKTVTIPNTGGTPTTPGLYFITFDGANLVASLTTWDIYADVPVAAVYYISSTVGTCQDERHNASRNRAWHYWAHTTIGSRYASGFLGNFSAASFSVTAGVLEDEDIIFSPTGTRTTGRLWRYNGTRMTYTNSTLPYLSSDGTAGGTLQYDNAGTPTNASVNNYVITDVWGVTDVDSPIWFRVGTSQYANLSAAQAALGTTASWQNIGVAELKLLYQVIFRSQGGTITYVSTHDYRNAGNLPGGAGALAYVGGAGTVGTIPKWATSTSLSDSILRDTGTAIAVDGSLTVQNAITTGIGSSTNGSLVFANSTNNNAVTLQTGVTSAGYALTLPTAAPGSTAFLASTSGGVLSWDTSTYLTANQTITLSGNVTGSGTTSITTTIAASAVTLAMQANLAASSIIGNNTGSPATPLALSGTQVTAMLDTFATNATTKGLVPGSNSVGTTYFLRADGSWAVPVGTIGGSIAANQIAHGSGANTIQGSANLTFDGSLLYVNTKTSLQGIGFARATAAVSTVLDVTTCYFTFTGSTASQTITLPAANLYGATRTQVLVVRNKATVTVTVARAGSDTIDGATSIILAPGDSVILLSDGNTAWDTNGGAVSNNYPLTDKVTVLTDANPVVIDSAYGNDFIVTLTGTGHVIGVPANPRNGAKILIKVAQGAGGFAYTFDTIYQFTTANPFPTTSTAAGAVDVFGFEYNATANKWWCLGHDVGHA